MEQAFLRKQSSAPVDRRLPASIAIGPRLSNPAIQATERCHALALNPIDAGKINRPLPERKPTGVSRITFHELACSFHHCSVASTKLHEIDLGLHQAAGIGTACIRIVQLQFIVLPEADGANFMRTWWFRKHLVATAGAGEHDVWTFILAKIVHPILLPIVQQCYPKHGQHHS